MKLSFRVAKIGNGAVDKLCYFSKIQMAQATSKDFASPLFDVLEAPNYLPGWAQRHRSSVL